MSVKLIVTDLDGTFFENDHQTISKRNIEAFKTAHEMGIKTAIASGRTKSLTGYALNQVPFIDYLITSNGAAAYGLQSGELLATNLMDSDSTFKALSILKDYSAPFEVYCDGKCYIESAFAVNYDKLPIPPHFRQILKENAIPVDSISGLLKGKCAEKINIMCIEPAGRPELERELRKIGDVYITSSITENLEINHYNANKGYAVKRLCELLNFSRGEIMCFGDGENDTEMLEYADLSYAMANGCDKAKQSAKHIAPPNCESGVGETIFKILGR